MLGSKLGRPDTEQLLKNGWPGGSHSCTHTSHSQTAASQLIQSWKEFPPVFLQLKKKKNQLVFTGNVEISIFILKLEYFFFQKKKDIFCKNYCFGLTPQNWTSLYFSNSLQTSSFYKNVRDFDHVFVFFNFRNRLGFLRSLMDAYSLPLTMCFISLVFHSFFHVFNEHIYLQPYFYRRIATWV